MSFLVFHIETSVDPAAVEPGKFPHPVLHTPVGIGMVLVAGRKVRGRTVRSRTNSLELIKVFFEKLDQTRAQLVSYNGCLFGFPVLTYQALQLGLSVPTFFSEYTGRYNKQHTDLANELSFFGAASPVSLDQAARMVGFSGRFGASTKRALEIDVILITLLWSRWRLISGQSSIETTNSIAKQCLKKLERFAKDKKEVQDYLNLINLERLFVKNGWE